jgi:hypothetical protein
VVKANKQRNTNINANSFELIVAILTLITMTNSKKRLSFFILAYCSPLFSCHKSHENPVSTVPNGTDVYIYGSISNGTATAQYVYYKNGKSNSLSNATVSNFPIGHFLVNNNSIFAVGESGNTLLYWEDGVEHSFSNPDVFVLSGFTIAGTDMYTSFVNNETMPGTTLKIIGGYVVNGTTELKFTGEALGIVSSGSDIYCYGFTAISVPIYYEKVYATYYKNKVPVYLGNVGGPEQSVITSMCISGNDVYATGYTYIPDTIGLTPIVQVPVYWKNGIKTILQSNNYSSYTSSIAVKGNDVYVAGYIYNGNWNTPIMQDYRLPHATLWKNGIPQTLSQTAESSSTTNIALSGNDVYVGGYEGPDSVATLYWKNGAPVRFKFAAPTMFGEGGIQVVTK